MRAKQPVGEKGSLKWMQRAVARRADLLQPDGLSPVTWLSPLVTDDYAEYRDTAFLEKLEVGGLAEELGAFWPGRGPQWDALGLCREGPVLVEAKAHLGEFLTPACQAKGASHARIADAMSQVRIGLGAGAGADWMQTYYQYANRLAHLWWFHLHGIKAQLVLVGFLNDEEMGGPRHAEVWEAAYRCADYALGLPRRHLLSRYIHHLTPDTGALAD